MDEGRRFSVDSLRDGLIVLVVALPLFNQSFPHGVPVFMATLAAMLLVGIAVPGLTYGLREVSTGPLPFLMIVTVVAATYVYGMLIDKGPDPRSIARELSNGIAAIAIIIAAHNSRWSRNDVERITLYVCRTIVALTTVAAIAGLYKLGRLLQGQLLSWVASEGRNYPWGTSLVADYNFYALTMLVGLMAVVVLVRRQRGHGLWLLALIFMVLLTAGALAGSRRFWAIAPILLIAQFVWAWRVEVGHRESMARFFRIIGSTLLVAVGLIVLFIPEKFAAYVELAWTFEERFRSVLDPGQGLTARASRWSYALQHLGGSVSWTGAGFHYMTSFGCEFLECAGSGYPHMPLLSAFLFAGIFGLSAGILLYVVIVVAAVRLGRSQTLCSGLVLPLVAVLLFSSISGNGPLSSRSFIVLGSFVVFLAHHLYRTHTQAMAAGEPGKA